MEKSLACAPRLLLAYLLFAVLHLNGVAECYPEYQQVENRVLKRSTADCTKLLPQYGKDEIMAILKEERKLDKTLDTCWNETGYEYLKKTNGLGEFAKMDKEYVVALISYTGDTLYRSFNSKTRRLLSGNLQSGWKDYPFKGMLLLLFKAFETGNHFGCGGKAGWRVYRGMSRIFDVQNEKNIDGTITMRFFTSTSKDLSVTKDFMASSVNKTLMTMDISGTFICAEDISVFPNQKEILIPPFRNFELISQKGTENALELELVEVGESCLGNNPVKPLLT